MGKPSQYSQQLKSGANKGLAFQEFKRAQEINTLEAHNIAQLETLDMSPNEFYELNRKIRREVFGSDSLKSQDFSIGHAIKKGLDHHKQDMTSQRLNAIVEEHLDYYDEAEKQKLGLE